MTESTDLHGKICLVTGASSGIGKATSLNLARLGATVIMVARNSHKAELALKEIKFKSGNDAVELIAADLSRLSEVRHLADAITSRYFKLDILVNNAAIFKATRSLTEDGFEMMFATNTLAPFLLTNLLLETLSASGEGQVINVTAPSTDSINFDDLNSEKSFEAVKVFGMSKMGLLLFTFELARRLQGSRLRVNAIYPGLARTNLMHEAKFAVRLFVNLSAFPVQNAAQAVTDLIVIPAAHLETPSGGFYYHGEEMAVDAYEIDHEIQNRFWEASARLVGLGDSTGPSDDGAI